MVPGSRPEMPIMARRNSRPDTAASAAATPGPRPDERITAGPPRPETRILAETVPNSPGNVPIMGRWPSHPDNPTSAAAMPGPRPDETVTAGSSPPGALSPAQTAPGARPDETVTGRRPPS